MADRLCPVPVPALRCGLAYPIASRIPVDDAATLGHENDRYGRSGRTGAQHSPEAINGLFRIWQAIRNLNLEKFRICAVLA